MQVGLSSPLNMQEDLQPPTRPSMSTSCTLSDTSSASSFCDACAVETDDMRQTGNTTYTPFPPKQHAHATPALPHHLPSSATLHSVTSHRRVRSLTASTPAALHATLCTCQALHHLLLHTPGAKRASVSCNCAPTRELAPTACTCATTC